MFIWFQPIRDIGIIQSFNKKCYFPPLEIYSRVEKMKYVSYISNVWYNKRTNRVKHNMLTLDAGDTWIILGHLPLQQRTISPNLKRRACDLFKNIKKKNLPSPQNGAKWVQIIQGEYFLVYSVLSIYKSCIIRTKKISLPEHFNISGTLP